MASASGLLSDSTMLLRMAEVERAYSLQTAPGWHNANRQGSPTGGVETPVPLLGSTHLRPHPTLCLRRAAT